MPSMSFGLVAARNKPEALLLEGEIATWLARRGVPVHHEPELRGRDATEVTLIIVLGGDGLMMRCARMFPDIPLLGINFGHIGFLTLVERAMWVDAITAVLDGAFEVQRGPSLAATVQRAGQTLNAGWCINDAVVRAGPQMVETELYIGGRYVNTYPGDGLIVSTPQGSTAYCMAAGGPILTRSVRGFAIVPLNPHSPARIPLVVGEDEEIELVITNDKQSWLYLDGDVTTATELARGDTIQLSRGPHSFALVLLEGMNFFDAIRSRFNFLIRPNVTPSRLQSS